MYKETKKQRFDKVSVARTQKIIDMIRLLGNCANKNNYSYDEKDAMMLFQQIENALDDARACFNFSKTKSSMDKYKELFETEYTWLKGFMRNVDRYGNKSAMFFPLENKQWTYSELNIDANKFANALIRIGIRKKDVIFCQMKNSPEFVFAYIASHKIGSVFAPINYRLAPAETAELIKKSKPEVIMIDKCLENDIKKAIEISGYSPKMIIICDSSSSVKSNEENTPQGFITYERFVSYSNEDNPELPYMLSMYDETVRLFTSGSTGKSKGVVITSINEVLSAHDVIMHLPLNCTDISLNVTPWYHRGGLQAGGITPTLYGGGSLVIMPHFDAKSCLKYIEKYKLTYVIGVPTIIEYLSKMQQREGYDISSLNGIIAMGSPLNRADCIRYQKILTPNIYNGYGTTETFWNTFLRPFDLPEKAGTSGISCVDDDVRVVKIYKDKKASPDDLVATDNTEMGEVIVKSPAKSAYEYSTDEEERRSRFYRGFLYTSDIATWDENHYITVQRRIDNMINSSGENINPEQVEKTICRMKDIKDCGVTSVPDKTRGEVVTAYIVKNSPNVDAKKIDKFCKESIYLANYKRPRYYRFVQEIPELSEKVKDRNILKQMAKEDMENGLLIRV